MLTALKEEFIELMTVLIALDDKIHRISADLYHIDSIHKRLEKRLKAVERILKEAEDE